MRDRKESDAVDEREEWLRLRCVAPITFSPIWEVVQNELRAMGIVHHNKGIEAGMHLEILAAEFLASMKRHEDVPDRWHDPYEKAPPEI